jgi:iron complex outermembrane receptor protein
MSLTNHTRRGTHRLGALSGLTALGLILSSAQAYAQASPEPGDATTSENETENDIVVTGTAVAQRKFDVSYAVTSLSASDIKALAPLSMADLFNQVPGVQAEQTGGEVQNNYRIRGIPNDGNFIAIQQDGMPIYQDNDGVFFKGDTLNRLDLMTEKMEFVRGGPAPVFGSNASAIFNQITVRGTDTPHGAVQVTLGDTDLYRLDGYVSGPLGKRTYFAAGGFVRYNGGYRDNGFPSDKGGQFRANIVHEFDDNNQIRVSALYLNDTNVFYLPIPIADPRTPSVSLDKYIDYFHGTLNTPALRNARMLYGNGAGGVTVDDRDLSDGRHTRYLNVGLDYDGDFGGWKLSAKLRHTSGHLDFDTLYSTTNPADAASFAASYLTAAQTAFGTVGTPVTALRYAIGGTNGATPYDPNSASGLVITGQYRAAESDFASSQGDMRLTHSFETGFGKHDFTAGLYASNYGEKFRMHYQDYLLEVAGQPRPLDLIAYAANGTALGSVTDNGVLRYGTTAIGGNTDITMYALYANDNWQITNRLRLDAGVRHERYAYGGYSLGSAAVNLGNPKTLADDATRAFAATPINVRFKENVTNWTVGANYDLTRHLGFYGRVSRAAQVPGELTVILNSKPVVNKANQYEAGIKVDMPRFSLYLTGFYSKFDPFNASFIAYNPVTGRSDQTLTFLGSAQTKGVEIDTDIRPFDWFSLGSSFTISDPTISNLVNEFGADAAAVDGNQLTREPKLYGSIRPTVRFPVGAAKVSANLRWNYVGKRYVDLFNNTAMAAYDTLGAGVNVSYKGWEAQLVGDNILNAHGITEGNLRSDLLAGQGTAEAVYGRPLFGRNVRLVLTRRW